jgi:hypothetical protein
MSLAVRVPRALRAADAQNCLIVFVFAYAGGLLIKLFAFAISHARAPQDANAAHKSRILLS